MIKSVILLCWNDKIIKTMKTLITILIIALAGFFSPAMAATDTLKIKTSAQCEDCKERIENQLNFTKGVKNAKLDLTTKVVTVVYDPAKTNPESIRIAITKAGYDADSLPADKKAYNKLPKCCKKGGHK